MPRTYQSRFDSIMALVYGRKHNGEYRFHPCSNQGNLLRFISIDGRYRVIANPRTKKVMIYRNWDRQRTIQMWISWHAQLIEDMLDDTYGHADNEFIQGWLLDGYKGMTMGLNCLVVMGCED